MICMMATWAAGAIGGGGWGVFLADTRWLKKAVAEGSPEWSFELARIKATGPFSCDSGNSIGGVTYSSLGMDQVVYAADNTHLSVQDVHH